MKTIKIWNDSPSSKQLDEITDELESGSVLIVPTDTLYGIACDALNPKAIEKVCRIKGINPDKTELSVICPDISTASQYARFDNRDFKLLRDNTPGPFTFLFRSASTLPKAFKGRKTVGIRIPRNNTVRLIAERLGHPLLTTSITFQDEDHAVNPSLIAENYESKVDLLVEGQEGNTVPSAIIDCTGSLPILIRAGETEPIF